MSVAVTFANQLEEFERQSLVYSNFLKVLSFSDPESIPLNIIVEGVRGLRLWSAPHASSSRTISVDGPLGDANDTSSTSPKLESLIDTISGSTSTRYPTTSSPLQVHHRHFLPAHSQLNPNHSPRECQMRQNIIGSM